MYLGNSFNFSRELIDTTAEFPRPINNADVFYILVTKSTDTRFGGGMGPLTREYLT